MNTLPDDRVLPGLGDAIAAATERDLRRGRRRGARRVILAVAVLAILGTGTVAAATMLTPRQVAVGMPAGAAIFDQTDPTCSPAAGGAYRCTLASAPKDEPCVPSSGTKVVTCPAVPGTQSVDYRGSKEVLAVDGKVAGGCVGVDERGLTWDCYVGTDAVKMEIITQDFLGEPVLGPSRG